MIRTALFCLTFFVSTNLLGCPFASGQNKLPQQKAPQIKKMEINRKMVQKKLSQTRSTSLKLIKNKMQTEIKEVLKSSYLTGDKKGIQSLQKCATLLEKSTFYTKKDYQTFITHLRVASLRLDREDQSNLELKNRVQKLCYEHFQVNLNPESGGYEDFVGLLPDSYLDLDIEELNLRTFNKEVAYAIFSPISTAFLIAQIDRKIRKNFFMNWDPALHSTRSKIAHFEHQEREVSILRMGCPISGSNIVSKIDPIFISYLNYLKNNGKKHLYINNQNRISKSWEKRGSRLLSELAKDERYASTFYLLHLPYDSAFYKQANLGRVETNQFISQFKTYILEQREGFEFPKQKKQKEHFPLYLSDLFARLHATFFQSKAYLEQVERAQFIDIAYAYFAKDLIEEFEIEKVNWTCKHGIDRAMTSLAVFDGLLLQENAQAISLDRTLFLTYWPALSYYRRPPRSNRVVRGFAALKRLQQTELSERKAQVCTSLVFK